MNCDEANILLHALVDGELDAENAREIEAHVGGCTKCAAALRELQSLRKSIDARALRYAAPPGLWRNIEGKLPVSPAGATSRRVAVKGFALGAAATALAASGLLFIVTRRDERQRVLDEIVSAHLRSLQGDHLTDIDSSDQHTVKPWFKGRFAGSPPVMDLTAQGFTLMGARIDYVDAKPVAAIVYRRRVHVINLFCEPAASEAETSASMRSLHGFNVRSWREKGIRLWAVSDISVDELSEFGEKFAAALKQ
jgi:anti-sigma factor RsiW